MFWFNLPSPALKTSARSDVSVMMTLLLDTNQWILSLTWNKKWCPCIKPGKDMIESSHAKTDKFFQSSRMAFSVFNTLSIFTLIQTGEHRSSNSFFVLVYFDRHSHTSIVNLLWFSYFETFRRSTKFSFPQKWNDAWLLLINMVYITSCQTTWDLGY